MTARVLVVGAGAAGLTAAGRLAAAGLEVTVVDKGRGVGGRLATRRVGAARIDHGAQFFTARSDAMRERAERWLREGVIREWCRGFRRPADGHPRYVGDAGMTSVAKHLAGGLDVHADLALTGLHAGPAGRYGATTHATDGIRLEGFEAVVATPPVPQTLALLDAGGIELHGPHRRELEAIGYDPALAALVVLDGPSGVPEPGGVQLDPGTDHTPLTWIGDNQAKGVSPVPALTLHAAPAYARRHWDRQSSWVAADLLAAARPWIGPAAVAESQVMRWRYATPVTLHDRRCLATVPDGAAGPLVFAGDAFGEARVEGAVLSGLEAADAVLRAL